MLQQTGRGSRDRPPPPPGPCADGTDPEWRQLPPTPVGTVGPWGCKAGDATPMLSQRASGRVFGSGGSWSTPGLGRDVGLPTALRVVQLHPRRCPPQWSVPLGWGRGSTLWGRLWGPLGGRCRRVCCGDAPWCGEGLISPRSCPLTWMPPQQHPGRKKTHPPPPKTLGGRCRAGRFSAHPHCCRCCQWGQGTRTAGGEVPLPPPPGGCCGTEPLEQPVGCLGAAMAPCQQQVGCSHWSWQGCSWDPPAPPCDLTKGSQKGELPKGGGAGGPLVPSYPLHQCCRAAGLQWHGEDAGSPSTCPCSPCIPPSPLEVGSPLFFSFFDF